MKYYDILVIDNDTASIEILSGLKNLDSSIRMLTCSSGTQGIEILQQLTAIREEPSAIIFESTLDVDLAQFVDLINANFPKTKKIVVTTDNSLMTQKVIVSLGIDYIIYKPYNIDTLIQTIKKVCDGVEDINSLIKKSLFAASTFSGQSQPVSFSGQTANTNQTVGWQNHVQSSININPEYKDTLSHLVNNRQSNAIKQTIITINSPKGGVGKTSISKEVAAFFSKAKVNGSSLKVLLVDFDLEYGGVASSLKLPHNPNIGHLANDIEMKLKKLEFELGSRQAAIKNIKYTQAEIEPYLLTYEPDLKMPVFYVLSRPANLVSNIKEEHIDIIIESIKVCDFDIIIFDTGPNAAARTIIPLQKCHKAVMVVTMDIMAIRNAQDLIRTLKNYDFPINKMGLVINKLPEKQDIDIHDIVDTLGLNLICTIPDVDKIRNYNNMGYPAVFIGKDKGFIEAINKLCNNLVSYSGVKNINILNQEKTVKKKGGLLSRFFG